MSWLQSWSRVDDSSSSCLPLELGWLLKKVKGYVGVQTKPLILTYTDKCSDASVFFNEWEALILLFMTK